VTVISTRLGDPE